MDKKLLHLVFPEINGSNLTVAAWWDEVQADKDARRTGGVLVSVPVRADYSPKLRGYERD